MPMPSRHNAENQYRYTFQGQEKDAETGKEAFELRLWDARIGRWLSPDPYSQYDSPYLGMGNNPISLIDPDGGMAKCKDCPNVTLPTTYLSNKRSFFQKVGHFFTSFAVVGSSAANAFGSNNLFGAGRTNPEDFGDFELEARLGHLIGDVASLVTGSAEIVGGTSLGTASVVAEPFTVGVSTIGVVAGAGIAVYGTTTATLAAKNTAEGIKGLYDSFAKKGNHNAGKGKPKMGNN